MGSRFAASMWIKTKRSGMQWFKQQAELPVAKVQIHIEVENWVYDDALDDNEWVSELTISCQEAKVLEALQNFANTCIVQWSVMMFSAPTNLNHDQWCNH